MNNVDACLLKEEDSCMWEAIHRDESEQVILSAWGTLHHCFYGEVSEAFACLECVKAIAVATVQPESNCAVVIHELIHELNRPNANKSAISTVLSDVKEMLHGLMERS